MNSDIPPLIGQIILALIAAVPGSIALWKGFRKEKAEVADRIVTAAGKMVEGYKERLSELEEKVEEQCVLLAEQEVRLQSQEAKIRRLQRERRLFLAGVQALCNQIRSLGYEPVWEPRKEKDDDRRDDSLEKRNTDGVSMG